MLRDPRDPGECAFNLQPVPPDYMFQLHKGEAAAAGSRTENTQVFLWCFRPALRAVADINDFDRLGKHPINDDERQRRQR